MGISHHCEFRVYRLAFRMRKYEFRVYRLAFRMRKYPICVGFRVYVPHLVKV